MVISNLYGKNEYAVFVYKDTSTDFEVVLGKKGSCWLAIVVILSRAKE